MRTSSPVRLEFLEMYREADDATRCSRLCRAGAHRADARPWRRDPRGCCSRRRPGRSPRRLGGSVPSRGPAEGPALARVGLGGRARAGACAARGSSHLPASCSSSRWSATRGGWPGPRGAVAWSPSRIRVARATRASGPSAGGRLRTPFALESVKHAPRRRGGRGPRDASGLAHSEVGQEEQAQGAWSDLWRRVEALLGATSRTA